MFPVACKEFFWLDNLMFFAMSVKATSHISGLWTETSRLVENAIFSVSKLKNSTNEEKKNVHTQFYRFKTRG